MGSEKVVTVLAEVYAERGVPADRLPYTEDFEAMFAEVVRRTGESLTRADFWRRLTDARKRGVLPRVAR